MRTHVEHHCPVDGDCRSLVEVYLGEPARWLPEPGRQVGPGRWRLRLHAGPARHDVIVEVGAPWSLPDAHTRSVRWWPEPAEGTVGARSRLLPQFHGRITLRLDGDSIVIAVAGDYEPPGGLVGAAIDVAGMRQVAHVTLRWLARGIADRLAAAAVAA